MLHTQLAPVPKGTALEFLPAVLEIQEAPPSPVGRAVVWTIMSVFAAALLWASLSTIDIVAVAHGALEVHLVVKLPRGLGGRVSLLEAQRADARPYRIPTLSGVCAYALARASAPASAAAMRCCLRVSFITVFSSM
jgi:hypothetical protein